MSFKKNLIDFDFSSPKKKDFMMKVKVELDS